jgi:hypothetical protein
VHELWKLQEPLRGGDVDGTSVERAAELLRYFKAQPRRAWSAMARDLQVQAAQEVLDWLRGQGELCQFSRTWLHLRLRGRQQFGAARSLDVPLQILERHGYIRTVTPSHVGIGRHPSDRFALNPLWQR